jgi:hypothetical protein
MMNRIDSNFYIGRPTTFKISLKNGGGAGIFFNKNPNISVMLSARFNLKTVFCRLGYDESNAKHCMALSVTPVAEIAFLLC